MTTTTTFGVDGMTCGHCVSAVTSELSALPGVADVVDPADRRRLVDRLRHLRRAPVRRRGPRGRRRGRIRGDAAAVACCDHRRTPSTSRSRA